MRHSSASQLCGAYATRGAYVQQGGVFSYVSLESQLPADQPLRAVRALLDEALASMSHDLGRAYAEGGRGSVPLGWLVRAPMEQFDYDQLFRWFVGLSVDEPVWDHSTFTKNRERLIETKVARKLLRRVVRRARDAVLLSNEHCTVDGTLIESWVAVKGMRRRDGCDEPPGPGRNPAVDFHGERRTNETHVAAKDGRKGGSTLDGRTTRHAGDRATRRFRKQVEEIFGWGTDGRPLRKMKVRGLAKVRFVAGLTVGCCALLRVLRLTAPPLPLSTWGRRLRSDLHDPDVQPSERERSRGDAPARPLGRPACQKNLSMSFETVMSTFFSTGYQGFKSRPPPLGS